MSNIILFISSISFFILGDILSVVLSLVLYVFNVFKIIDKDSRLN